MPAYVIDRRGTITWLNGSARDLVGDAVGRRFTEVLAPEDVRRGKDIFARKLLGSPATDFEIHLLDRAKRRVGVDISSVPVRRDEHVVGVFGLLVQVEAAQSDPVRHVDALTPRQHEILRLLAQGRSTREIAEQLGLATHTVRNHVRGILRALDAESRLEAVVVARDRKLV